MNGARRNLFIALFGLGVTIGAAYSNCSGVTGNTSSVSQPLNETIIGNPFDPSKLVQLPKIFLASDYPVLPPDHNVLTVGQTGRNYKSCQAAVNDAVPGDEVVIDAGFNCGKLVLPDKGAASTYIVIRSANLAQLPPGGKRIARTDAANMAVIESTDSDFALKTDLAGVPHHYYLDGLEIRLAPSSAVVSNGLVLLGTTGATTLAQLPHDITLRGCWIHAQAHQEVAKGVIINGAALSIVDSVIDEIHAHNQYAQGVAAWNTGAGPFKIVNNEIVSAADNIVMGMKNQTITGLVPSDIEIRQNHLHKLVEWQQPVTGNTGLTGQYVTQSLLKLMNADRVLITGNILENCWAQTIAGFASNGNALSLTPTPGTGQDWIHVQNITVTNNIVRHSAGGAQIKFSDPAYPQVTTSRLVFSNNLFYDIGPTWGSSPALILLNNNQQDFAIFNHNTMLSQTATPVHIINTPAGTFPEFYFTNNIVEGSGILGGGYSNGAPTLNALFPKIDFRANLLVSQAASDYGSYATANFFVPALSQVGFAVDPSSGVTDFTGLQLQPSSAYHNAGTDGKDLGADINSILQALAQ